ncbi:alpha/beta fold hydrolase [Amycolatopsis sp. 195334CR]|uniref:alpha/beta fold hydrolase n=1 Tax=Amycolatopsis sp. 195334CR TaxID=2814588 RepID=UPI001A8DF419|nr:alpha/beta hydrolase [Amycolatopsis sp. 195334CR]MBN6041715.1 alpha/beta hydrolase [Amycolatopsis sp. 195334CR]
MRVVHVHGACTGDAAWWWHRMVEPLRALGFHTEAVSLPSCRTTTANLHDDADAVREVLAASGEPTILSGHSYGGMVITDAATGFESTVERLVYLAAVVPAERRSLAEITAEPSPWLDAHEDGTVAVKPGLDLTGIFLQDCTEELAAEAATKLVPQSAAAFAQAPRGLAWRTIPSTYIVLTRDRATPPERQRAWAAHATETVDFDSGHHPFLSRPAELARLTTRRADPSR